MLGLNAQKREKQEKLLMLREGGTIPSVLYGPKAKPLTLKIDGKEFQKVYEEAGESSLIQLKAGEESSPVLIREIQRDPVKGQIIHVDFYQPPLDQEIEVAVPLEFEGEAPAVNDLGGTLVKNIHEISVKALPQNLPSELVIDVSGLKTFEDRILVSDIVHDEKVEILREGEEVVAQVTEQEDIEAQLEEPVVENVEGVEQVKPEREEAEGEEGEQAESSGEEQKKEEEK